MGEGTWENELAGRAEFERALEPVRADLDAVPVPGLTLVEPEGQSVHLWARRPDGSGIGELGSVASPHP